MNTKLLIGFALTEIQWEDLQDYARNYLALIHEYNDITDTSGTNDGGADSISYVNQVIFAFSKEKGWRKKLREDAVKVSGNKNSLYINGIKKFVFVTNRKVGQYRDLRIQHKKEFGWDLEIFQLSDLIDGAIRSNTLRNLLNVSDEQDYIEVAKSIIDQVDIEFVETSNQYSNYDNEIYINYKDSEIGKVGNLRFNIINNSQSKVIVNKVILKHALPFTIGGKGWTDVPAPGIPRDGSLRSISFQHNHIVNSELDYDSIHNLFVEIPILHPAAKSIYGDWFITFTLEVSVQPQEIDYKIKQPEIRHKDFKFIIYLKENQE
ncbi:hypothetical protein SFC55_20580 [Niallia taxi]|uniref:hypothetical protein n=1 Tax=Niallia taxi TaxID=2499688 RepID=UPI003981BCA7